MLLVDVANCTAMSEKLDPEEVYQVINGCFKILMDQIHRYGVIINQFTGDGVMALFGGSVAHEDYAQRACHTALSIQKVMGEYGEKIEEQREVVFKMRVGIGSALVIVAPVGDDFRMDYATVGDTTNLVARFSRLQSPAKSG